MANVTFNCGGRLNRPFGIEVSSKKNTNLVRLAKYSSYEKVHPALGNLAINFLYAFHPLYMVFLKEVARDIKGNNDITLVKQPSISNKDTTPTMVLYLFST